VTRVVVSVGTDHHPFGRMLEWISAAGEQLDLDVFVQRGATPPRPGLETADYVAADELADLMRGADAVVCHGGPGTISLAQSVGRRPIVVARDPSLGEHVDDHQMRYTARLAADGQIDTAQTLDELVALLSAPRPVQDAIDHDDAVAAAVAEFGSLVHRLLTGELPKRRWRDRILVRRVA
jgi:UDP-N-acetylglucosamine transferase subunit ALG13